MNKQIETSSAIDDLENFKLRFGFEDEVTAAEFAEAFRISIHTLITASYRGSLLGAEPPKFFKKDRKKMYKAIEIMNWNERAKTQNL
jgi:Zn-dependent peptidase ImmA (M78 family)